MQALKTMLRSLIWRQGHVCTSKHPRHHLSHSLRQMSSLPLCGRERNNPSRTPTLALNMVGCINRVAICRILYCRCRYITYRVHPCVGEKRIASRDFGSRMVRGLLSKHQIDRLSRSPCQVSSWRVYPCVVQKRIASEVIGWRLVRGFSSQYPHHIFSLRCRVYP